MHDPRALIGLVLLSHVSAFPSPAPPDPCALLTPDEVAAASGWKPASTKHESDGATETCRIAGSSPMQVIVIVLAKPGPRVTSSAGMAAWRKDRAARLHMKVTVTPVEGLGAPAIRTDEDSAPPTVEAAIGGRLLGLSAPSFELARTLAAKAIARLL